MTVKRNALRWFSIGLASGLAFSFIIMSVLGPRLFPSASEVVPKEELDATPQKPDRAQKRGNRASKPEKEVVEYTENAESDSIKVAAEAYAPDTQYAREGHEPDIVLAQDELLHRQVMSVSNDSIYAEGPELNIDSLLIDDWNEYPVSETFQVEFWSSPINYKGYRLQKNKLVLYGLDHFEDASLWRISQKLYLRYHDNYYLLSESPEFKQLVQIALNPSEF